MSSGFIKNVTYKLLVYKSYVFIYTQVLALNNLHGLIEHKTQITTQPSRKSLGQMNKYIHENTEFYCVLVHVLIHLSQGLSGSFPKDPFQWNTDSKLIYIIQRVSFYIYHNVCVCVYIYIYIYAHKDKYEKKKKIFLSWTICQCQMFCFLHLTIIRACKFVMFFVFFLGIIFNFIFNMKQKNEFFSTFYFHQRSFLSKL